MDNWLKAPMAVHDDFARAKRFDDGVYALYVRYTFWYTQDYKKSVKFYVFDDEFLTFLIELNAVFTAKFWSSPSDKPNRSKKTMKLLSKIY